MTDFKEFIQLAYEDSLDLKSTKKAFMQIMNGEISEIQISSFISLLQKSGVKSHHVIAALEVMRKKNALNQCTFKYNGHMRYRG